MTIRTDPENNETRALFDLVDFSGQHVLEIGCSNGRLTWLYAGMVAQVTAIEPFAESIGRARENLPKELQGRVSIQHVAFGDFTANSEPSIFDTVILSWSLC
jgi:FkbM family methyltransferase